MYGAILGDIAGSRLEFTRNTDPRVPIWTDADFFTDDTVLSCAVAEAASGKRDFAAAIRKYYALYPGMSYGRNFHIWARTGHSPYQSAGNGAVMRISPVAYMARSEEDVLELARQATEPSHSHPDAIASARFVALLIYRALQGRPKAEVLGAIGEDSRWSDIPTVAALRRACEYSELAVPSVRAAIACVRESSTFEEAIRNAVSLGGDADTIAAIAGSIAEPLYGIPDELISWGRSKLDDPLRKVVDRLFDQHARFYTTIGDREKSSEYRSAVYWISTPEGGRTHVRIGRTTEAHDTVLGSAECGAFFSAYSPGEWLLRPDPEREVAQDALESRIKNLGYSTSSGYFTARGPLRLRGIFAIGIPLSVARQCASGQYGFVYVRRGRPVELIVSATSTPTSGNDSAEHLEGEQP